MSAIIVRQAGMADLDYLLDLFEDYREFQGQARDNVDAQALYEAKGWRRDPQFHMYHRHPPGR